MTTIRITTGSGHSTVEFRYDEAAVDIIRGVLGRRWDANARRWTIPTSEAQTAAKAFTTAGFPTSIDGVLWTSPATGKGPPLSSNDPIGALWAALPAPLREPVYKALVRVLHPDAGGDTRLMQELNKTRERYR